MSAEELSPRAKQVFDTLDSYRVSVAKRAREAGIMVRTGRGKEFQFPENKPNYFPHSTPSTKQLKNSQIKKEVVQHAVDANYYKNTDEATKALDSWIEYVENNTRGGDYFAQKMVENGYAKNLTEAKGKMLRFFNFSRQGRYGNLEKAREVDFPFYDPNPQRVWTRYIDNSERRLAEAKVLGPNLENVDRLLGGIVSPETRAVARLLIRSSRETAELSDAAVDKLLNLGRRISTLKLSPPSAIKNLGQSLNPLMDTNTPAFIKGVMRTFTPHGWGLSVESGAISPGEMKKFEEISGAENKFLKNYLKTIGFTPSERLNRRIAANVGFKYAQTMAKKVLRNNNRFARQQLLKMEINPDDVIKNKGLTHNDYLRAARSEAERTQYLSRNIDLPIAFTKTELGKNMAQFKTFAYQQTHFLNKSITEEFKAGNPGRGIRNLFILALVFPLAGEVIADIRNAITGRKRESKGLQRYLENIAELGGLGIMSDVVSAMKYGVAEYITGPTISTIGNNIESVYRGITNGKITPSQARGFFRQIPAVGPILSNRIFPYSKSSGGGKTTPRFKPIEGLPPLPGAKVETPEGLPPLPGMGGSKKKTPEGLPPLPGL
jgi:hypothetical protein